MLEGSLANTIKYGLLPILDFKSPPIYSYSFSKFKKFKRSFRYYVQISYRFVLSG